MPAISVLMPCYNVTSTIDEALSSLVMQSLMDYEVVLVDDGSTDGTVDQLQEWVRRDQRFRVVALPHQGIIPAMNAGLDACKSNYIARMDADDRSTPNRLMRQVEMLVEHPGLALISGLVKGFPEAHLGVEFKAYINWLNTLLTGEDIKHSMFIQSPFAHPSVAYRKDWVERVGGYQDHGWAEDYDLWLRLYLAGADFGKVPEVLLEWRDHPRRLTHTDDRYSKYSDLRLKAHYLLHGPLSGCEMVIIWGSDATAKQVGEQLLHLGCHLSAYVSSEPVHPDQVYKTVPAISPMEFFERIDPGKSLAVLVAENDPQRRVFLSKKLETMGLHQGRNWWLVG